MNKKLSYLCSLLQGASFLFFLSVPMVRADVDGKRPTDPRAFWHYACALYAQQVGDADRALAEFQQSARYDSKSSTIHDRMAYHYYVEGLDYKSVEELQKSKELAPNNIETRLLLANLLASQGEYSKAQKEYLDILKIEPQNVDARFYLASVLANQNRTDEALQQYQDILAQNPRSASVYYNMGLIYTRANQATKAEEAFKKAIELDPNLESAYTSLGLIYELDQKPQEAITAYQALVKVNPDNAQAYLAMGELFYNQKDDAKALEAFQNYAQQKPDDLSVNDYIGLCHLRLKQYPEAIESFQKLLDKQPANALVRYRLAAAYEETKENDKAEEQLRAILTNDEKSVDAWVRLVILCDREKNLKDALKAVQDGLKAVPNSPDLLLMQAMLDHESNNLKQAEAEYRKVIEVELALKNKQATDYGAGTLSQAYFDLGSLLDKQGKFNEAMDQMKKVLQLDPSNADAYNYIGYSYADKGIQLDEAQKDIEAALKIDPTNSYYMDSLGWVYYRRGKFQEAKDLLEKALKALKTEQKDDAAIYDHLGEVLLKMGQKDEALAQWQKASKLDPDNKDYPEKIKKTNSVN